MKVISVRIEGAKGDEDAAHALKYPTKPDPRLNKHNKLVVKYQKKADALMEKNGFTRKGNSLVAYTRKGGPTVIARGNIEALNAKGFGTSPTSKNLPVRLFIGWYGTSTATRQREIPGTGFEDFWKKQVPEWDSKVLRGPSGHTENLYQNLAKDYESGKTEKVLKEQFEALKTFIEGLKKKG